MYRLDTYCGTALLRTMYTKKHLLYSGCLCSLIFLICFNFRSVVSVVSGKIILTTLLCRELIVGNEKQTDRQTDRRSSEDDITIAVIGSFET